MNPRLRLALRIGAALVAVTLLGWFAYAHAGQSVRLEFGLFTLRRVSLPVALYGAVIAGMLIVIGADVMREVRARRARRYRGERRAPASGDASPSSSDTPGSRVG